MPREAAHPAILTAAYAAAGPVLGRRPARNGDRSSFRVLVMGEVGGKSGSDSKYSIWERNREPGMAQAGRIPVQPSRSIPTPRSTPGCTVVVPIGALSVTCNSRWAGSHKCPVRPPICTLVDTVPATRRIDCLSQTANHGGRVVKANSRDAPGTITIWNIDNRRPGITPVGRSESAVQFRSPDDYMVSIARVDGAAVSSDAKVALFSSNFLTLFIRSS